MINYSYVIQIYKRRYNQERILDKHVSMQERTNQSKDLILNRLRTELFVCVVCLLSMSCSHLKYTTRSTCYFTVRGLGRDRLLVFLKTILFWTKAII